MKNNLENRNEDQIGDYGFASDLTGISKNTLYGLVCRKRIPHIKINRRFVRFSKVDLSNWLDSHKVKPKEFRSRT
jgi:excisionase family DNA binding protein